MGKKDKKAGKHGNAGFYGAGTPAAGYGAGYPGAPGAYPPAAYGAPAQYAGYPQQPGSFAQPPPQFGGYPQAGYPAPQAGYPQAGYPSQAAYPPPGSFAAPPVDARGAYGVPGYPQQGFYGGGYYAPPGYGAPGYDAFKALKKDKKQKKKDNKGKKPKSADERKQWKEQKKAKKTQRKSAVAATCTQFGNFNQNLVNNIQQANMPSTVAAEGPQAKTVAEQWTNAGQQEGLEIWRIEKFKVVPWPKEHYGKFYSGDSYIVLNTYRRGGLRWDLHFWLGEHTTQDEAGTAAYKTVELDEHLGGMPVQHREVEGFESEMFLSYFPLGIQILQGGVESGFNVIKPQEYRPRLLHLKGTKAVRVTEVSLTCDSLNSGDVFILDAGLAIYQWNGRKASINEKRKGTEISTGLKSHRGGKPNIHTVDEGSEEPEFWDLLGGKGAIASAEEGGSDLDAERMAHGEKALFRLSDVTGQMTFSEVARGRNINKSMLDTNDVFIFDSGYEIFAWVGKGASPQERKLALQYAQDYLLRYNRPPFLPITRVMEGGTSQAFDNAFK